MLPIPRDTEQFEVRTGVKQGDPLSPVLFSIVMDVIIRKLEIRGNISIRLKRLSAYADDVLIMARTKQTLIDTFLKLKNEALKYGLIVNENKTKYLKCTRKQIQDGKLSVESMQFEQVESFKYLGSIVNKNNTIEEDIKERIMAGNKAFYANKRMFQEI
jgi:porphobilinogen deaminase